MSLPQPVAVQKTSDEGLALIRRFEGLRLVAYRCSAGVPTIGYGHTKGVHMGMKCTADEALDWLAGDVMGAEGDVRRLVTVPLAQQQFDALVSFAYNLGGKNLGVSTLLKHLNAGRYKDACGQFKLWNRAGGKPVEGLTRRRAAEADLFAKGIA